MEIISLEDIKAGMPGITPTIGAYLYENLIMGMHISCHKSGVCLQTLGIEEKQFVMKWQNECTAQMKRAYTDTIKVTEETAVGLSLLLTRKLTDYTIVERSWNGTGIDYWLGYENDPMFSRAARLEISGILQETPSNTITRRVRVKDKQTDQSDNTSLPAFISVAELSTPKLYFNKK